jgi:hypothetical protein
LAHSAKLSSGWQKAAGMGCKSSRFPRIFLRHLFTFGRSRAFVGIILLPRDLEAFATEKSFINQNLIFFDEKIIVLNALFRSAP